MKHIGSISEIIERAKRALAIESDTKLAEHLEMGRTTLANWKKGKGEAALMALSKLADQQGWALDWLLRGIGPRGIGLTAHVDEFAYVPLLPIEVSAGGGAFGGDETQRPEVHLAFRRDWLRHNHLAAEHLCAVQVRGNSMEPTLRRGDTVLINLQDQRLADGELLVVRIGLDGGVVVKRAALTATGSWALRSDNQLAATDYLVSGETAILGRVVWVGVTL